MTFQPSAAYCRASSLPRPRETPVISAIGAAVHFAHSSSTMSWSKAPTSCTASGSPFAARPNGKVTHGTPNSVQARLNTGSPVDASDAGAAPGAEGVRRKSTARSWSVSRRRQSRAMLRTSS